MSRESIGRMLKIARKSRNMTQDDIGASLFCDRAVISKIENGKYPGALLLIERYINLMGYELHIISINKPKNKD